MRNRVLAAMSVVTLAALVLPCRGPEAPAAPTPSPAVAAADWPMFRGGPQRLGSDGCSTLPEHTPAVRWVFSDGTAELPVTFWSSPLVAGERLYVGGGTLSPFGTHGAIYCLDAAGPPGNRPKVLWRREAEKFVCSSPSLAGGLILCGEGTHTDTAMRLHALSAVTTRPDGERAWDFPVAGTVEASPSVAGAAVFFGTGDDFYCLDSATGKKRWKATIIDVLSSPAVGDGMVFVGSGRSEQARPENRAIPGQQLLALDVATGEVRWRQTLRYACSSPITCVDGKLVAGSGKGTFNMTGGGGRSGGEVVCHEARTGKPLWSRPLPDNVLAALPVECGRVHVACRDGKYYLLSLADGAILWEYPCDSPLLASPVVSGDRVLLLSSRGVAYCLDFKAQTMLWKLDLPRLIRPGGKKIAEVFSSPVLAGNRIYLGLGEVGLVCLQPRPEAE